MRQCYRIIGEPHRFLTWQEMVRFVIGLRRTGVLHDIHWSHSIYYEE